MKDSLTSIEFVFLTFFINSYSQEGAEQEMIYQLRVKKNDKEELSHGDINNTISKK